MQDILRRILLVRDLTTQKYSRFVHIIINQVEIQSKCKYNIIQKTIQIHKI